MKMLNWMQSKLNGRHGNKKPNSISANDHHMLQEPCKEECSDWPHGLLAIGTFGNNNLKEDPERSNLQGNSSSSQDHLQNCTPEDVELQNELNSLLHRQVGSISETELEIFDLPSGTFPNCPSSLEVDRINSEICSNYSKDKIGDLDLQCSNNAVLSSGKDSSLDNTNSAIGKKSLSFLLKKTFVCRRGFAPAPSLRDPLPESRMEKILRAILHKKIYPQNSSPPSSIKKYLENRQIPKSANGDDIDEKADNGSKWIKTDSEYIVLEI